MLCDPYSMEITVSGQFTTDVFDSAHALAMELWERLNHIDLSEISSPLKGMVYFPMIFSPGFDLLRGDRRSYSRKEQAEFVHVEISHSAWVEADIDARRKLMLDGLVRAINGTNKNRLPDEAKRLLVLKIMPE